jgi:hypothetical protein
LVGLVLLVALSAQACVSVNPWRPCKYPCQGPQFREARTVEICTTHGVPLFLDHARWGSDDRGDFLSGRARTKLGQPLGDVKVYVDEIDRVWTERVEGGRVATNLALVPLGLLVTAVTGELDTGFELWESEPEDCPPPGGPGKRDVVP